MGQPPTTGLTRHANVRASPTLIRTYPVRVLDTVLDTRTGQNHSVPCNYGPLTTTIFTFCGKSTFPMSLRSLPTTVAKVMVPHVSPAY